MLCQVEPASKEYGLASRFEVASVAEIMKLGLMIPWQSLVTLEMTGATLSNLYEPDQLLVFPAVSALHR